MKFTLSDWQTESSHRGFHFLLYMLKKNFRNLPFFSPLLSEVGNWKVFCAVCTHLEQHGKRYDDCKKRAL